MASLLWVGTSREVTSGGWDTVLWNPSTGDYKILTIPSFEADYLAKKVLEGLGYCNDTTTRWYE